MLNRYFADFFVKMSRQQSNNAGDFSEVQKMIIENYDFQVTESKDGNLYLFKLLP